MKQYPSIPNTGKEVFDAYIFDKLDGSNLRFEWDRKLGWCKFGTRQQMLSKSHPTFGIAIPMFLETLASPLEQIAKKQGWSNFTAFCEFWGEHSFAGFHESDDLKHLSLLDVQIFKRGFVAPELFLELFSDLEIPRFLGMHRFDQDFIELVKHNQLAGITFEGVIGKLGSSHKRLMQKAKTQMWLDCVRERFDEVQAIAILNS